MPRVVPFSKYGNPSFGNPRHAERLIGKGYIRPFTYCNLQQSPRMGYRYRYQLRYVYLGSRFINLYTRGFTTPSTVPRVVFFIHKADCQTTRSTQPDVHMPRRGHPTTAAPAEQGPRRSSRKGKTRRLDPVEAPGEDPIPSPTSSNSSRKTKSKKQGRRTKGGGANEPDPFMSAEVTDLSLNPHRLQTTLTLSSQNTSQSSLNLAGVRSQIGNNSEESQRKARDILYFFKKTPDEATRCLRCE